MITNPDYRRFRDRSLDTFLRRRSRLEWPDFFEILWGASVVHDFQRTPVFHSARTTIALRDGRFRVILIQVTQDLRHGRGDRFAEPFQRQIIAACSEWLFDFLRD